MHHPKLVRGLGRPFFRANQSGVYARNHCAPDRVAIYDFKNIVCPFHGPKGQIFHIGGPKCKGV